MSEGPSRHLLNSGVLLKAALLGCLLVGCESLDDGLSDHDRALLGPRRNLRQLDLSGADMTQTLLVNADLSESLMAGANFQGNDLSALRAVGASFDRANLSHTRLGWSVLRGSSLRGTNFYRCSLVHSDLRGADLNGANLTDAALQNVHLMGTQLADAKGLLPSLVDQASCWDERTQWPANWQIPSESQICDKHGQSNFARRSAVRALQHTNETKLLMRDK